MVTPTQKVVPGTPTTGKLEGAGPGRALTGPDLVIIARVGLAFLALGLFSLPRPWSFGAPALIVLVIAMDGLDGHLARRAGIDDRLGGLMDITADRIVEHVFWIYFAVAGLVPLWVPLVVATRSFLVDAVRGVAAEEGRTAFGPDSMMTSAWSRFLVSSRFMRNAYGLAKVAAFVLLGVLAVLDRGVRPEPWMLPIEPMRTAASLLVGAAVVLNLLRGVPVLWDGRKYLSERSSAEQRPRSLRDEATWLSTLCNRRSGLRSLSADGETNPLRRDPQR